MNEQEIASDLRAVIGNLVRRARATDAMPQAQAAVLGFLDREGPMTTSELAARQQVRHQTAARVVAQLAELGLVRQKPHPNDGRKVLLMLTEPGLQALQARRGRRADWLAEAIKAQLSPAEQRHLAQSVTLLKRLAQHGDPS
ncbi:MarR family winged helix-turn-helix transcriptional regulator [Streptomyces sp. NPDC093261]|uniref:MarR family winged helix-turn-helix transcriptional regulator n=1 Tax=Streptomyces sp. NPDC093261 TaxID=3366037 RepID=UPI003811C628